LRLVPTLAGIAAIPLLAALARRVGGDRAGIWTRSSRVRTDGGHAVRFREDVRSGIDSDRGGGAADVARVEKPGPWRWAAYTVTAAAAVWMDYFSAVALAGIFAAAVCCDPTDVSLRPPSSPRPSPAPRSRRGSTLRRLSSSTPARVSGSCRSDGHDRRYLLPALHGPTDRLGIPFGLVLVGLQFAAVLAGSAALAWRQSSAATRAAARRRPSTACWPPVESRY